MLSLQSDRFLPINNDRFSKPLIPSPINHQRPQSLIMKPFLPLQIPHFLKLANKPQIAIQRIPNNRNFKLHQIHRKCACFITENILDLPEFFIK